MRLQRRAFSQPEEVRTFAHGKLGIIQLDETVFGELRLEPGWRWSQDIRPISGTGLCEHHHVGIALAGRLHVVMGDGSILEFQAGDAYEIPPGHDAWVVGDEQWHAIEFSGSRTFAVPPNALGGGIVATLLFTDIVGSTSILAQVGDARWREMLLGHNAAMRAELDRFRGRELKTTGDGFLAAFDSATRAARCAHAMVAASKGGGLDIRVGCHTGEVELVHGDAHGVAVHVAARVMALAGPGEVLASWTTRDLLDGSGLRLDSAGHHELKGLQGVRELFRVAPVAVPPGLMADG